MAKKVKVLFNSYQSNRSGAPRFLHHIVKHLDKDQFEPYVIFANDGPIVEEFKGVAPTIVVPTFVGKFIPYQIRWRLQEILLNGKLRKIFNNISPDVIYLNTIGKNAVSDKLIDFDCPKIVHFHEIDNEVLMQQEEKWLQRLRSNSNLFIGCAQAVSQFMVTCLDIDKSKVATVYGAIDVEEILQSIQNLNPEKIKQSLGISSESILIGSVGKPSFRKGVDLFIGAAAEVLAGLPELDLHFVWVGGNSYIHNSLFMQSMRSLVYRLNLDSRFHWVHEVEKAAPYQDAMDTYVVPSREDPFPLAMLEAMLIGVPVIGFAVNGVPEALGEDRGIIVDNLNSSSLAEAMIDFLKNRSHWSGMRNRAREYVKSQHDIVNKVQEIEELILNII